MIDYERVRDKVTTVTKLNVIQVQLQCHPSVVSLLGLH